MSYLPSDDALVKLPLPCSVFHCAAHQSNALPSTPGSALRSQPQRSLTCPCCPLHSRRCLALLCIARPSPVSVVLRCRRCGHCLTARASDPEPIHCREALSIAGTAVRCRPMLSAPLCIRPLLYFAGAAFHPEP